MDTQNFNLCHRPSANNSEDSTSEIRAQVLSAGPSSGHLPDVVHQKRGEPLINTETN